ncbi:hypothetical protein Tco_0986243 [Tanacetum coccineum]
MGMVMWCRCGGDDVVEVTMVAVVGYDDSGGGFGGSMVVDGNDVGDDDDGVEEMVARGVMGVAAVVVLWLWGDGNKDDMVV